MNKDKLCLPIIALVLSLFLAFSVFFNVLKSEDNEIMTGITAIFGGEIASFGSFASARLHFNFTNFIAFFLPIIIVTIWVIVNVNHNATLSNFIFGSLASVTFIVSVILIFGLPTNTVAVFQFFGFDGEASYEGATLGIGAIVAYISAILGAISAIVYSVLELKKLVTNK